MNSVLKETNIFAEDVVNALNKKNIKLSQIDGKSEYSVDDMEYN